MRLPFCIYATTLLLSGCASLTPGSSREADVIAYFGQPTEKRPLPDGGSLLEFPRTPLGYENWRVILAPDGTVRVVEQLLDEAHFNRLKPGMTITEVTRELGRPAETSKYAALAEEVVSWRFMDFSRRMFFNAHFDAAGHFKYSSRTEELVPLNDGNSP